jgi:hypothetical protein
MKYANIECFGHKYTGYLLLDNMDDLHEYINNESAKNTERIKTLFQRSTERLKGKYVPHADDVIVGVIEGLSELTGMGNVRMFAEIVGAKFTDISKHVCKGERIAVNHNGGYFPIPNDAKITYCKNKKYQASEIRITKYPNGQHYYATIRDVEVIDEYGDKKWNTEMYAYQHAKEFIKKLNNNL